MPVFDFTNTPDENHPSECTYTLVISNKNTAFPERPILLLDNRSGKWNCHSNSIFTNPVKRTSFRFRERDRTFSADIFRIDARFVSLLQWPSENRIQMRLSDQNRKNGYAVYRIREFAFGKGTKLSTEGGSLQFMTDRLFVGSAPEPGQEEEESDELGNHMKLTGLQSTSDFMACTGRTMPDSIRLWIRRNLAVARSHEVSPEEKRHAQRALSVMVNIQWKNDYFESTDPVRTQQILDEEPYGMEQVKQRIIGTIIQTNHTHTPSAYGLLLTGPTGTGKSQIAYTVARILRLPWTALDMSFINDPEQLTGSSRIYANAKPGIIMETFFMAGESNLVFIIDKLDKAAAGKGSNDPVDALLTLLDNPSFTDNYTEYMIPTAGVYPIATANNEPKISAPLISRLVIIDIPDYTPGKKRIILSNYALPKVLTRMSMREQECTITEDGLEVLINQYRGTSEIRDLKQVAERIAANALYQTEVDHVGHVVFGAGMVRKLPR